MILTVTMGASMTQPFDEQTTIRIEHDLHDARVFERDAQMVPQGVLQLADEAGK